MFKAKRNFVHAGVAYEAGATVPVDVAKTLSDFLVEKEAQEPKALPQEPKAEPPKGKKKDEE